MAREIVNLDKLEEALEAADAAMEAATLAAEKVAEAVRVMTGSVPAQPRQQVGARVTAAVYRQLKERAALQGVAVGTLVEQAISEFMERAAGSKDAA